MFNEPAIKNVILTRLRARQERERLQRQLIPEDEDFAETIRVKLHHRLDSTQYWNFCRCGDEDFYRTCKDCGKVETYKYRCNIKWCPRCQWRITETRKKVLALWSMKINQPKHLILTQKNFPILTRRKIKMHNVAFAKLRRTTVFEKVLGGCRSVEITNESRGWHLHSHCLLDVRWLDMPEISRIWGKLVGQEFAIVKVKDVETTII